MSQFGSLRHSAIAGMDTVDLVKIGEKYSDKCFAIPKIYSIFNSRFAGMRVNSIFTGNELAGFIQRMIDGEDPNKVYESIEVKE